MRSGHRHTRDLVTAWTCRNGQGGGGPPFTLWLFGDFDQHDDIRVAAGVTCRRPCSAFSLPSNEHTLHWA